MTTGSSRCQHGGTGTVWMAEEEVIGCAQQEVYNAPHEDVVGKGNAVKAALSEVRDDLSPYLLCLTVNTLGYRAVSRVLCRTKSAGEVRRRREVLPQQRSPAEESMRASTECRVRAEDHHGS